jgi:sensor histidine kinase YesM
LKRIGLFTELFIWLLAYLLFTFYLNQRLSSLSYATSISTSAFVFFVVIIYCYSFFFYPRFYKKEKKIVFALVMLLFLLGISFIRVYTELAYFSRLYSKAPFFTAGRSHLAYVITTNCLALLVGILLKGVRETLAVKLRQAELEKRQLLTEMKLLKAQLQPHFLFNSLNNIYYEVYKESPKGALLIEKLSEMMRFFLQISSAEKTALKDEAGFIKNYIALEQIRFDNNLQVRFNEAYPDDIVLPPMLLVPLVENVFKHGIDKMQSSNPVNISLTLENRFIVFETKNNHYSRHIKPNETNTGLTNLRERLNLLYADNYSLSNGTVDGFYITVLKIPVE